MADPTPTPEPRWLDPDEMSCWLTFNTVMFKLLPALDQRMQRSNRITMFEYLVLAMLSESPDRSLQLKELARIANGSLSRLSHVLKRLEGRDWVRRTPMPGDGRITIATLTDKGYAKLVKAAPSHVEDVRQLVFDQLSAAQVGQLQRISDRLVAGMEQECSTAATQIDEAASA